MMITLEIIESLKNPFFKTWFEKNIKEKVDLQELKARLEKDKEWRLLRLLYKNGFLNGEFKYYYENGNLFQMNNWQDGKKHGAHKWSYENGNVEREGVYENGERQGLWIRYYENGNIEEECNYENGEKNGVCIRYFNNGDIKSKGNYEDDRLHGAYVSYEENRTYTETSFIEGSIDGLHKFYSKDGVLLSSEIFEERHCC